MTQSRLLVWWRLFDARRAALGLAPSRVDTAWWYYRRAYLPEEAAAQDLRWLQGSPRLLGAVP